MTSSYSGVGSAEMSLAMLMEVLRGNIPKEHTQHGLFKAVLSKNLLLREIDPAADSCCVSTFFPSDL